MDRGIELENWVRDLVVPWIVQEVGEPSSILALSALQLVVFSLARHNVHIIDYSGIM